MPYADNNGNNGLYTYMNTPFVFTVSMYLYVHPVSFSNINRNRVYYYNYNIWPTSQGILNIDCCGNGVGIQLLINCGKLIEKCPFHKVVF